MNDPALEIAAVIPVDYPVPSGVVDPAAITSLSINSSTMWTGPINEMHNKGNRKSIGTLLPSYKGRDKGPSKSMHRGEKNLKQEDRTL